MKKTVKSLLFKAPFLVIFVGISSIFSVMQMFRKENLIGNIVFMVFMLLYLYGEYLNYRGEKNEGIT